MAVPDRSTALRERLADMAGRYPEDAKAIAAAQTPADALETRLADAAGLDRAALDRLLGTAWATGA